MRRVKIVVVGANSMLMDPMTQETLLHLANKTSPAPDKDVPISDRARKRLIMDNDGYIGIPVAYLRAALVTGGRRVKYGSGRGNLSTAESTNFFTVVRNMVGDGAVDDDGDFLRFETCNDPAPIHKKKEFFIEGENKVAWCADVRRGVGENSGITNAIIRPMIPAKYIRFTVTVDYEETEMSEAGIRQLFAEAGRIGVGAFRPECKGPFGRLEVESFVDISPEEWIAASKGKSSVTATVKRGSKKSSKVQEEDLVHAGAEVAELNGSPVEIGAAE